MTLRTSWPAVLGLALALGARPALAQDPASDGAETARVHLGPLGLTPRLALTNFGVDTNVLNQDVGPQRDVTASLAPGVDSWLRVGRAHLSAKTGSEITYFRKLDSQRSIGLTGQGRAALALNWLMPAASFDYADTYRRPNAEIDARVRQRSRAVAAGANVRLGWRTAIDLQTTERRIELDDEQFLGVNLAQSLNRRSDLATAQFRFRLTPLTTFVVKNTMQRDRFTLAHERDTDSFSVVPGLEFKPLALISGTAFAGFRRFDPRAANQPVFSGVVAAVALSYLAGDMTRFSGKLDRDVDYSLDFLRPYFVSTSASVSVTQAVSRSWDVVARAGRQQLDYQNQIAAASAAIAPRLDRILTFGSGVGYRFASDVRVGFDVNHARRLSPIDGRRFSGFQFGGSFTYGY